MSLQVQTSQQPTSGRRTPQIYQNLGTTGNTQSPTSASSSSTNGNSGSVKSSKLSLKASTGGKQSPVVEANAVHESTAQKDRPKTPNLVVAVTKIDKTPTSTPTSPKADKEKDDKDKGATNGSTNGNNHNENETNGKHEPSTTAETPKKDTTEKVEKEKKIIKENPKPSPRSTPQKQQQPDSIPVEQLKTPENAGKKSTPEQKMKIDDSLLAEKPLKGFSAEGDEMESLVVEPSEYEDSPMPPRTGGKTKLLKYAGVPPTRARISPFRVHEANTNASTIVNLSTVSEGGQSSATESKETSPSLDFNRPLRAISGRRGTRPISDIQFTYRKSTELNDSTSSLNVTIGSEIHNDSLRTPAAGSSRKRKAMTPESTSDALDVKEVLESPKRTRLDFSGFLGMVASPVTMLKNRLSRVRLQSSTPVVKRNFDDEDPSKCVQAEATTTTANISGQGTNMDMDTAETVTTTPDEVKKGDEAEKAEGQTDLPIEKDGTQEDGSGDGSEPPVEVKDVTNKQRQFCIVM